MRGPRARHRRLRRTIPLAWTTGAAGLVAALATLLAPAALATVSPDQAATNAYDRAEYKLYIALAADTPTAVAKSDALARQLGQECHGVLARAPDGEEQGPLPGQKLSARQRGERARFEGQFETIHGEVIDSVAQALGSAYVKANEAFAHTIEGLSWSDPRITAAVHQQAKSYAGGEGKAPPAACADMRAWAGSGFERLSAASRILYDEQQDLGDEAATTEATKEPTISAKALASLLKQYESPVDRRLLRRAETGYIGIERADLGLEGTLSRLNEALGLPESREEELESTPPIAKGRTATGERFEVRTLKTTGSARRRCRTELSIRLVRLGKGGFETSSSSSIGCVSERLRSLPERSCGENPLSFRLTVSSSVHEVSLRLSNGRTITSRVALIPRRDGGPESIYIQSIKASKAHPVSLTELASDGRTIHVLKISYHSSCPISESPEGPMSERLAQGVTPDGRHFTIEDDGARFKHETDFSLAAYPGQEATAEEDELSSTPSPTQAFSFHITSECEPHPYAILYGVLASPGASVEVRTSEGLLPLTKVEVPTRLGSGGPLFYGVFSSLPSELVVLRSDGSTLYSESLTSRGSELVEYCAGYDEPAS